MLTLLKGYYQTPYQFLDEIAEVVPFYEASTRSIYIICTFYCVPSFENHPIKSLLYYVVDITQILFAYLAWGATQL